MVNTVIKVMTVVMLIIIILTPVIYADINPDDYKPPELYLSQTGKVVSLGKTIVGVIQTIGVVVSVVTLMVLGLKYMMGSPSDKADYKKTMIPYLIGVVLLFTTSTLTNIIYNFAKTLK